MKLSQTQEKVLHTLAKPFKEHTKFHPTDAYNSRTINSLTTKGLVEKYTYPLFVHDAVRLTEAGQKWVLNSKEDSSEIRWYAYRLRGFSLGCQPKGFVDTCYSYGKFGAVAYKRKLTKEEVSAYELTEIAGKR
ncbi:hypothetical protein [Bacillus thuringiensis]|uniref:defense against restriction DarA-related protein n=1 Tax=Bacillus thuringiensis TaxID=1428 RepID=UPI000BFCF89F|nr:hypothetical protein [Bacillus thuringiensis]PGT90009.1 hypothetical protein COD17_09675 [Bacillus thuringiensis]